jgi:ligand-binding sensor domain-containing protein
MIKQIFAGICFLLFIESCKGQNIKTDDPYFVLVKDTISTHGPRNITRSLLQDKKGNIWFASWEGIVQYDGKQFINHTLQSNLRQWHSFSVLEDKAGNIWFGSIGGGAYKYDGQSFTLFNTDNGLGNNIVECMLEDADGNIWFGTHGGISKYDGTIFTYFTAKDGLASNYIHSIEQDATGKIWIGTEGGVNLYQPTGILWTTGKTFTDFKHNNMLISNVRSIVEDKNKHIWIGSNDGLMMYDGKTITTYRTHFIGNLFEDKKGNLWFSEGSPNGSNTGMNLVKYDGSNFTTITNSKQVFGIIEDTAGNIWFGTETGIGLYNGKDITYP